MKKSLIAFAALAAVAGVAQAQSSVSLYGILDLGVANASGATAGGSVALISGALSTSRWGVKGSEDLGGGLNAGFTLESEIAAGTGVAGGTAANNSSSGITTGGSLFHRGAFVSLSQNGLGSLTMGRMNRIEYDSVAAFDAFGGNNFGGTTRAGYLQGGVAPTSAASNAAQDARMNNAVKLQTASFNGLTLSGQVALGGQAGDTQKWSSYAVGANYKTGALALDVTKTEDNLGSSGVKSHQNATYAGSYDFGVAKVLAGHLESKRVTSGVKAQVDYLGVIVPVNGSLNVLANYMHIKNQGATSGAITDTVAVGATYALSKRTTAYGILARANNNASASANATHLVGAVGAGQDQSAAVVGVRHVF